MPGFTDLIDAHNRIEDVVTRYPATRGVFEAYGISRNGWEGPIRTVAWRGGIELSGLLEELNRAAVPQPCGAES